MRAVASPAADAEQEQTSLGGADLGECAGEALDGGRIQRGRHRSHLTHEQAGMLLVILATPSAMTDELRCRQIELSAISRTVGRAGSVAQTPQPSRKA